MKCDAVVGDPAAAAEVAETFDAWAAAVRAGDLETIVGLVAEDAEFWTNSRPPLVGREQVREAFAPLLAGYALEQDFDCHELVVAGEWALVRGLERNQLTSRAGGEPLRRRQRAFSVLRRGDDGVWRFARGMTNLPPEEEAGSG
jgi:uncharacterized protein (TIGR02246 family)